MGETENSTFHDLAIFGPIGPLIYGFEYTTILFKYTKYENMFKNYYFLCLKILVVLGRETK